jgi:hypothetical protein
MGETSKCRRLVESTLFLAVWMGLGFAGIHLFQVLHMLLWMQSETRFAPPSFEWPLGYQPLHLTA